jgi:hypothetical protein
MTEEQSEKSGNGISVQEIILKTIGKAANSPAETVLKYIVIGIMTLFGVVVWYTWQSNLSQPERLYTLLEKSIAQQEDALAQQTKALQIQQSSLDKIQEFTIRVQLEHQQHAVQLSGVTSDLTTLCKQNTELRDAIRENTVSVSRLISLLENRAEPGVDP